MRLKVPIISVSDYKDIFSIALSTAKKWHAEDKRKLKVTRLTIYHLSKIYGIPDDEVKTFVTGK